MAMNDARIRKIFANHKAIFSDYGNIKILDFKKPESSDYRIRFLFEEYDRWGARYYLGRTPSGIVDFYLRAFELAEEALAKSEKE